MLGWPDNDNRRSHVAEIVKWLVLHRVLVTVNRQLPDAENLSADVAAVTAHLAERRLALYLFRLKNGNASQRSMFKNISQWFAEIAGSSPDARMNTLPTTDDGIEQQVELITDDDIPFRLSGTGRTQLAWLATIVAASSGHVLVLDEPDAHLFPALQR